MPQWLAWAIRALATIESVDAFLFMANAGWAESEPILVALAIGGFIGLPLVWLAGWVLKPDWLWLGIGAILVAIAPAAIYPLSLLLIVAGAAVLGLGSSNAARARKAAAQPTRI